MKILWVHSLIPLGQLEHSIQQRNLALDGRAVLDGGRNLLDRQRHCGVLPCPLKLHTMSLPGHFLPATLLPQLQHMFQTTLEEPEGNSWIGVVGKGWLTKSVATQQDSAADPISHHRWKSLVPSGQ